MVTAHDQDFDVTDLADWLATASGDRLWTVDGEPRIAGALPFPATGAALAAILRRLGGRVRLHAETPAASAENISDFAVRDNDDLVFELAWLNNGTPGEVWTLVTDTLAEAADRAAASE